MNYDPIPVVYDYGLINLHNFDNKGNKKMTVFYIMPLYEMDMKTYLRNLKGINKIDKILHIVITLVSVFKYVHCAKRTHNDLKLENVMINTTGSLEADP